MPYISPITEIINTNIKQQSLYDKRFQKGLFEKVATLVTRNEGESPVTYPAVINDLDGDATDISFDDTFPFIIYHRIESINHNKLEPNGDNNVVQETANMVAVVYGDRNILLLPQEELISGVQFGFPQGLSAAQKSEWNLISCDITTGAVELNSKSVFEKEVNGVEYNLKPNSILFSIAYTISTEYNCLEIC